MHIFYNFYVLNVFEDKTKLSVHVNETFHLTCNHKTHYLLCHVGPAENVKEFHNWQKNIRKILCLKNYLLVTAHFGKQNCFFKDFDTTFCNAAHSVVIL